MACNSCCGTPVGGKVPDEPLEIVAGRDVERTRQFVDGMRKPLDFPAGSLVLEVAGAKFPFSIAGSVAYLKVKSEVADLWPQRSRYQIFWLPAGEAGGGQAVAIGSVRRQQ